MAAVAERAVVAEGVDDRIVGQASFSQREAEELDKGRQAALAVALDVLEGTDHGAEHALDLAAVVLQFGQAGGDARFRQRRRLVEAEQGDEAEGLGAGDLGTGVDAGLGEALLHGEHTLHAGAPPSQVTWVWGSMP